MKLSVKGITMASALLWGSAVLFTALANLLWPPYGQAFLEVINSIYPGYAPVGTVGSIAVGTGYALLDGAVAGAIFAWLYNRFVG